MCSLTGVWQETAGLNEVGLGFPGGTGGLSLLFDEYVLRGQVTSKKSFHRCREVLMDAFLHVSIMEIQYLVSHFHLF